MKILWVTPIFPYPPFSGGQTRAYNLLKNLAKKNEITLFSFLRPGRIQGPVKKMAKYCLKIKTFPGRPILSVRNFLLAGFSHLPFAITHFYGDSRFKMALEKELKTKPYDLIHFESFYTSPYLRSDFGLPAVLGNENVEYLVYQRFVQQRNFLFKLPLNYDVWKMRQYEQSAWKRASLNLAVSEVDASKIEEVTSKKCEVIPNGVDISYFRNFTPKQKKSYPLLLFVGDFRYFTNQDALTFLVKEIWPEVKKVIPKVKLWLVGKNPSLMVKNLAGKDVIVDSGIDDIRQAYAVADILVAPMRIASGTNIKVLEAMAAGLPVVTTSLGVEGIKAKKDKEVIVAGKKDQIISEIINLLKNETQRQKIGLAGRRVVERFYDWEKIGEKLNKIYEKF